MIDESLVIVILGVIATYAAIQKYIEVSRDASVIYLNEQAHIDVTRLENESAIHKSNKLDYSHGLRVGLDIRYDHYKLRNGNLADIWEVVMNFLKKKDKSIKIGNTSCTFSELNHKINSLGKYFKSNDIKVLGMNFNFFLDSKYSFAIMMSCFVNQITVNLYDNIDNTQDIDIYIIQESEAELVKARGSKYLLLDLNTGSPIPEILNFDGKLLSFENIYTLEKDRGIALRLTRKASNKIISNVDFIQMNLVSSLASMLKHLPEDHAISSNDKILIVQSFDDNEEVLCDLNKVLISLITNCNLTIGREITEKLLNDIKPTILSLSETKFIDSFSIG